MSPRGSESAPQGARFEVIADARPQDAPWPGLSWPPASSLALSGRVVSLAACVPEVDAPALFQALDRDAVWQHVGGRPRSIEDFANILKRRQAEGRWVWVVRLLREQGGWAAGRVVGMSSYLEVSASDARLEIGSTAYAPEVWSTLVNTDAKLQLLQHAFEVLGAGRVQFKTDVRNQRSQRAIARLGARYEGTLRRYQRRDDGSVRDTVLFSIIAEEWPALRERLRARIERGVSA